MNNNEENQHIHLLDVEKVLKSKLGTKEKFLPRFFVNWLKKIIHQDELNEFLSREGDRQGVEWLWDCVDFLDMKLDVRGVENLPSDSDGSRYTFVSNHPLGGQDGVALGAILGKHYNGRIKYLVNDLLMNLYGLAPLCIPINKTGRQGRSFPAMVKAGFAGNEHIIMFPAGLCSRKQQGKIYDLEWKKTFVVKSVETQRDVIPIHFSGSNSPRFYRIANLCKRLGLKVNVAMLFLVDEMFKNRHKTFIVTIGKPIPWQKFDSSRPPSDWAWWVRDEVYIQGTGDPAPDSILK